VYGTLIQIRDRGEQQAAHVVAATIDASERVVSALRDSSLSKLRR
jgi:hypothetical protein